PAPEAQERALVRAVKAPVAALPAVVEMAAGAVRAAGTEVEPAPATVLAVDPGTDLSRAYKSSAALVAAWMAAEAVLALRVQLPRATISQSSPPVAAAAG